MEKGKYVEKDWNNENKLSSLIHECIIIENNIYILIKLIIQTKKWKMKWTQKSNFIENEKDNNRILYNIINFGNLYKENSLFK